MVRTNQGGSILGFVMVGAVMALLLVGGVFVVRHTLMPAMESGISTAPEDTGSLETSSDDTIDRTDDEESQPADESVTDERSDEVVTIPSQTADDSQSETESDSTSSDSLPETGPGSILLSGFLLGGVVAATLAYKRSRGLHSSL